MEIFLPLSAEGGIDVVAKVTIRYPSGEYLLSRFNPNRSTEVETEAENACREKDFHPKPTLTPTPSPSSLRHPTPTRPLPALAATLLPSHSVSSPSLRTFLSSLSFYVSFALLSLLKKNIVGFCPNNKLFKKV